MPCAVTKVYVNSLSIFILLETFSQVINEAIPLSAWIALSISGVLLVVSGFMSSSEVAFFSLSPSDIDLIKEEEHPADRGLVERIRKEEKGYKRREAIAIFPAEKRLKLSGRA